MSEYLFVGECRSETAVQRGWTWRDGHLAAEPRVNHHAVRRLRRTRRRIVALGQKVARKLVELGIDHIAIVHPAARGRIRKRSRYIRHVREALA
jgi:hypothetical protein